MSVNHTTCKIQATRLYSARYAQAQCLSLVQAGAVDLTVSLDTRIDQGTFRFNQTLAVEVIDQPTSTSDSVTDQ